MTIGTLPRLPVRWFANQARHGMGAVVAGDAVVVAGGGPQMGGGVKSAINEAFSLG